MTAVSADDLLVIADRIWTVDPTLAARSPDAVRIRAGRIVAIGSAGDLRAATPGVPVLDARGATLLPGLTDAHIHLTEWALARREVDLGAVDSPEAAASLVREAADRRPGDWIRGRGWNPHRWGGAPPGRAVLDALLPGRPVALQSHDMHAFWVNGAALRRAGIERGTADPEGGRIVRDADGEPTGLLLENATALVKRVLPVPGAPEKRDAVLAAQSQLHVWGITGVHAFPSIHIEDPDPLGQLEALHADGGLRLRVLQHLPLDEMDAAIAAGLRSGAGDAWVRVGGVKMFLDGALGSRTAWMREPYVGSTDRGVRVLEEAEFRRHVKTAAEAGLATTVHAIGDAAVGLALDVLAAAPADGLAVPHRIEHIQCCPPERLPDAGLAGITCSMQPVHLITDWPIVDRHWGPDRARTTYAFRSLARSGAVLAFGSDAPVEPADPRLGLFAAVTRTDLGGAPVGGWQPEQRLDLEQALLGYTAGPALAAGRPGRGGIRVGGVADLALWSGDPLRAAGEELLRLECVATVVGGRQVYG